MLKKLKVAQNKCIRFCLQTGNRKHVGYAEYEQIDWLPTELRHHQSVCALVHNFFENKCPAYMSDMLHPKSIKVQTRNSTLQLYTQCRQCSIKGRWFGYHRNDPGSTPTSY